MPGSAIGMQQETAATDARQPRFDNAQYQGGHHRGIHCIAALAQYARSGARRARILGGHDTVTATYFFLAGIPGFGHDVCPRRCGSTAAGMSADTLNLPACALA